MPLPSSSDRTDFTPIRLALFDVDGVMTNGQFQMDVTGRETKSFHSRDGLGLRFLTQVGIGIGFITGRRSEVVTQRAIELGATIVRQGARDKLAVLDEVLVELGLCREEVSYAGDDLIDLPVLRHVGLSLAPADACPEVLSTVDFVSRRPGGHGAVREMVEFILRRQGLWNTVLAAYA